jgi:hypothetical protein
MKITIISLVLVLFALGCSKKESASGPLRFTVAHGDIAPAEITTNIYKGNTYYIIQIKLSSAKEAELCKLAQQYPNREVEVVLGSESRKMRMPAKTVKPPIQWAVSFTSIDDAIEAEADLKGVSQ